MPQVDEINQETDLLFLLFNYTEEVEGVTKLQKLLFLLQEESEFKEIYENVEIEFEPYKYGPFSEQIYDEVELLINMGAIKEVDSKNADDIRGPDSSRHANKRFEVTNRGQTIAREVNATMDDDLQDEFSRIMDDYIEMPLDDLLEYVYRQYPDYTTESEIKEEILQN